MPNVKKPKDSGDLPAISLVLGITSLLGPGLLLGIPAIITGSIALRRSPNNQGFSIAGIIMGSISTLISILIIALVTGAMIWIMNNPQLLEQPAPVEQPRFESSAT